MQLEEKIKKILDEYIILLKKWNKKINLVSKNELDKIWERHILDSLELNKFFSEDSIICDLGTGAGFPGLIIGLTTSNLVYLVESDIRKCAFLNQACLILEKNNIKIFNDRIENLEKKDLKIDVFTSRALASIKKILDFDLIKNKNQKILLLKGESFNIEIQESLINYEYDYKIFPSNISNKTVIIEIKNVRKKS